MFTENRIGNLGKTAEDMVAKHLRNNGYIVIKRNYSNRYGEIDIIAEDDDNIVFVEVKARKENAIVSGAEAVDAKKINRIRNLSNDFISKFHTKKPPRFDVAEVTVFYDENNDRKFKLKYIKSADFG